MSNAMKPLPPVKPQEKLPETYNLTLIRDPDKSGMVSVVLTKMQGDTVLKRVVVPPSVENIDLALDEFNKTATRIFYFGEGEEYL